MGKEGENKYSKEICDWYDGIMAAGYYDYDKIVDALIKIFKERKKILELGIGTGLLTEKLISEGYTVSGLDFTMRMIELARKRLNNDVKLYYQNVMSLKLPEKFDAAFSVGGIWYITKDERDRIFLESHITDLKKNVVGLKNVAKHLSSGGLLILGIQETHKNLDSLKLKGGAVYSQKVTSKNNLIDKEYFVKKNGKIVAYQHSKYRRFTEFEKKKILKEVGFEEIGIDGSGQFLVLQKI